MLRLCLPPLIALAVLASSAPRAAAGEKAPQVIRVGIIGLDTSHVTAFTALLNGPRAKGELAGVRVVAAYPGGSDDIPDSKNRVAGFTATLRDKYKIEIVNSIEELLAKVDAVLLESVDGRPHLKQVIPVLKAGKPVFIDKPVAGSLADAVQIYLLAQKYKVPVFSSSSLRYYPWVAGAKKNPKIGEVLGCAAYGPCSLEPHHPDLFWYGIHGVETLFAIMGPDCEKVSRVQTKDFELVTGTWKGGRIGTFRGIRKGKSGYGATVFGTKGIDLLTGPGSYQVLVEEICKFFRTGQPPVSAEETLAIFAFMEAADESKRRGGAPVAVADVLKQARAAGGSQQ
ncbi:MAG: Gfo/Idh/MocA family oxidoreductase [Gemmataceae bacterium]|nr:Gfo/Idh/MocA family oxidoreductase [Gemmataceae bacterium]